MTSRPSPIPIRERTLHAIGDVQGTEQSRIRIMLDDLDRDTVPQVEHRVTLGDCSRDGTPEDFAYYHDNFASRITGELWAVVGNHDMNGGLDGNQAALALGMESKDYAIDMGFAALIVVGPDEDPGGGAARCVYSSTALAFLDAALTAHSDKPCIMAAHASLRNTVEGLPPPAASRATTTPPWFALDVTRKSDALIRDVLADHPNAKAWLGGHTHSLINSPNIVKSIEIGGRDFAAINGSSIIRPGIQMLRSSPIASPFVTVLDDRIEVRWRDHGAHQWVGGGAPREAVATVML